MAQIVLQNPVALLVMLVAWLAVIVLAWPRRFRPAGALLLRLVIAALIGLALAQPVFVPPAVQSAGPVERWIVLVDQSDSLGQAARAAAQAETARLVEINPDSVVLYFADHPAARPDLLNPAATDLAAALRLAGELLAGKPGRIVLFSDGVLTRGDVWPIVSHLARLGVPVDVMPLEPSLGTGGEVRLTGLAAPASLRQGMPFALEVSVHSQTAAEATLRLTRTSDGTMLAEDAVALKPGENLFTFETRAGEPGVYTFRATVVAQNDGESRNNSLDAATRVYPRPQVLVVGEEQRPTARLASQLQDAGFETRRIRPAFLADRLSELEQYDAAVLVNVSARQLTLEQMLALQEFVRSLGRGLLVSGGRQSYSLGSYADTPLVDLLPVTLEPPPREERPPVALLLLIDHSGSMVENEGPDTVTKLAMAKEAAIRATDILGPEDRLGVVIFDNRSEWVVPFQPVQDGAALLRIQEAIATIPGGGGTRILQALEVGLPALMAQDVGQTARHAVLLTDGRSFDGNRGLEDYQKLVVAAREAGVTLSTIAIGKDADEKLLMQLAEWGRGRYHFAGTPEALPELTISESDILRSNAVQEGYFIPSAAGPHPIVRGFSNTPLPNLSGYIALTPKARAETAFQVGPRDPLLVVWGYGLGRVAAWTSDVGQEWAAALLEWPLAERFWAQVVGYTLPEPGSNALLQLSAEVDDDGVVTLTADAVTPSGQLVDLAPPRVTLVTPAGTEASLRLRQVAPGRYQQQVRLTMPGAYRAEAVQSRGQGEETALMGFVVPYPAEYRLPAADTGAPLLRGIAQATGGQVLTSGETAPITNHQSPITGLQSPIDLWPWLLQVALILWPIEIAWRRWRRMRI